jgi:hypothetical protein
VALRAFCSRLIQVVIRFSGTATNHRLMNSGRLPLERRPPADLEWLLPAG